MSARSVVAHKRKFNAKYISATKCHFSKQKADELSLNRKEGACPKAAIRTESFRVRRYGQKPAPFYQTPDCPDARVT
jgi:hypothetical protein